MIDRKALKLDAREAMRGTRPSAVWVTLLAMVILMVLQALSLVLSGELETYRAIYESALRGELTYVEATGSVNGFAWLLTLALDLMTMVISVGYTLYTLRLHRRMSPSFGDVFDAFGLFFRAVWLSVLRGIILSLWTFVYAVPAGMLSVLIPAPYAMLVALPLLAPVIVASLSYEMAEYIMLDHPELSCAQCLALSRAAMRGRKWELFVLRLSFIGWYVLSVVPFVWLWVLPYTETTVAGWYDEVVPAFFARLGGMPGPGEPGPGGPRYHVPGTPWEGSDEDERDDEDAPQ